ncbi:transcriptional regulator with XRE-family HTH domain [Herbaspirillum rubrisubalbicans]|uniref:helix-turn-helix domain-containing protein n=1 Tax=Herbaspirillum rubrisubalbicans TaxID=80842 RepID=UPI00209D5187|nr:helix-turn-helix transcriptional regulator [Herbaspirillum rubrisubalbicans]MCP1573642.1 transcriptional regulator with XRE-family HTH domain [Herbaspirillum rubrisubalbicans]
MSTFGQRLKEERKRLGLTQPEFAAVGGVEKGAQINYEQDKRFPSAEYLIAVSSLGVDAQYVLLGKPSSDDLAEDEKELLIGYRSLDERAKARVLGVVEGAMPLDAPRTVVTVSGNVGQQIHGDVHGTVQGPDMRKQVTKKK